MSLLSRKDTEVIRVIPYDVSWAFMGIAGPDPKRRESSAPPLRAASIEGVAKGPSPAKVLLKNQQIETQEMPGACDYLTSFQLENLCACNGLQL